MTDKPEESMYCSCGTIIPVSQRKSHWETDCPVGQKQRQSSGDWVGAKGAANLTYNITLFDLAFITALNGILAGDAPFIDVRDVEDNVALANQYATEVIKVRNGK